MTVRDIEAIIRKTVFLSPNTVLLNEYLSECSPCHLEIWTNDKTPKAPSATSYFDKTALDTFYSHRHFAEYIWATKPLKPIDDISNHANVTVFQNNSLIYAYLTNKISQWRVFLHESSGILSKQLAGQLDEQHFRVYWRDDINENLGWLYAGKYGNRGSSFSLSGLQFRSSSDEKIVRATKFIDYDMGLSQSGIIYRDNILLLPPLRTWYGRMPNPLQMDSAFFDPCIENVVNLEIMNKFTIEAGYVLRHFGFLGIFGVDYLYETKGEQFFICEINPRYTGELDIFGISKRMSASYKNPQNLHNLHICAFINDSPIVDLAKPNLDFEEIGGGELRFLVDSQLDNTNQLGQYSYYGRPPLGFENRHVNETLVQQLNLP